MPKQVYKLRAFMKSFTDPNKKYTIKRKENGDFTCSCPSWIFSGEPRGCKHLKAIFDSGDNIEQLFLMADKFVLDIAGEKWEIIKDMDTDGKHVDIKV